MLPTSALTPPRKPEQHRHAHRAQQQIDRHADRAALSSQKQQRQKYPEGLHRERYGRRDWLIHATNRHQRHKQRDEHQVIPLYFS